MAIASRTFVSAHKLAQRLIAEATASQVLPAGAESSDEDVTIGRALCQAGSRE